MISILTLGFLIGLQHALEADHIAAVASIAVRGRSFRGIVRHGAVWGLGHALTLLLFGGAVLILGSAIPEGLALGLEAVVGAMLVALGLDVLRRLRRDRIHFHRHRHADGMIHLHAHSHAGQSQDHDLARHDHAHPNGMPLRSLLVGMMNGLAGSAALLILALSSVRDPWLGLLYIAVFGLGATIGMAMLSAAIAVPLSYSGRALTWAHQGMQIGIGAVTVGVGLLILYRSALSPWLDA